MRVAIIGTGNVGGALARGWARSGHEIRLGVRDPVAPKVVALAKETLASAFDPATAAAGSDVVVLALPWATAEAAVKLLGDLRGKIVIDCMNPLAMTDGVLGLDRGFSTSGAEALAAWIPGARVVKTLNQVGAELMDQAESLAGTPLMFIAGDDADAKRVATTLVKALGFEALDAGDLRQARLLEPFGMAWINQALMRGAGRDWAFGAIRRRTD
jgi:8-hydroxy-5-deazaflavin:NADPH oxidoreductase